MTTREKLKALSSNIWWSWNPDALALFEEVNPHAFRASNNSPLAALRLADEQVLAKKSFARKVDAVYDAFRAYMSAKPANGDAPRIAYFCMEYGLHESLPLYSGGLGVLAGDHVKSTSDLGLPFTAVGLFLRDGYFKQYFDENGWQQAEFPSLDATEHPLHLVTDGKGNEVRVTVNLGWEELHLRAWRLDVGRTKLYLLDSDISANRFPLRFLTRRLYAGDRRTRIRQEIILGIGGMRMLRALGVEADVYHLNEGHCAFLTFELMRERQLMGYDRHSAEQWVRDRSVFTTHTPVIAGHDRFDPGLFLDQMSAFREHVGMSEHDILAYGRVNPNDISEQFTMTVLGLKLAGLANGVSKLNGEVARAQWHHLYPHLPVTEVPIKHVTNGVHLPTWTAPHARKFLRKHLGKSFMIDRSNADIWAKVDEIPAKALWAYRSKMRKALVDYIARHIKEQTLPQWPDLDPDALTIGFARRFATYKRAPLLFTDLDRVVQLFNDIDRPIQLIYSGKAHPHDKFGQQFIHQIFELTQHPTLKGKLVFLENYNMEIGRMLTSGSDIWLNNPRRPYEASGTSGQKVAIHGGLNLSILDGWWPEGYDGANGWPIGHEASSQYKDPAVQDPEDAEFLYQALENEVIPRFYDRDKNGIPQGWVDYMRNALRDLPYQFSGHRMVSDYIEQFYKQVNAVADAV